MVQDLMEAEIARLRAENHKLRNQANESYLLAQLTKVRLDRALDALRDPDPNETAQLLNDSENWK